MTLKRGEGGQYFAVRVLRVIATESVSWLRVLQYERAHLRYFCCQKYGHVAAVCRGVRRRGRCGKDNSFREECKDTEEQTKCVHCEGNHHAWSAKWPKRFKKYEYEMMKWWQYKRNRSMLIQWTVEFQGKSEIIKMVLDTYSSTWMYLEKILILQ